MSIICPEPSLFPIEMAFLYKSLFSNSCDCKDKFQDIVKNNFLFEAYMIRRKSDGAIFGGNNCYCFGKDKKTIDDVFNTFPEEDKGLWEIIHIGIFKEFDK
jgi:hypothetical protein